MKVKMTAADVVQELTLRLISSRSGIVYLSAGAVGEWPHGLLDYLLTVKFLRKAAPAANIICPECHYACSRPIVRDTDPQPKTVRHFVICDRRSDISNVPIDSSDLDQWQLSVGSVAEFLKIELKPMPTSQRPRDGIVPIGRISGVCGLRLVSISTHAGLDLTIGGERLPVTDLIFWHDGKLTVDRKAVQKLVDRDENLANQYYVPSTNQREARKAETADRHRDWSVKYRRLKRENRSRSDNSIAIQIGREDPREPSSETVRRVMKRPW
jgi:hypothetical protein